MTKKKVAIVAGGDSGEYEVSINSAAVVYKNLNRKHYDPYTLIIKGSDWYYEAGDTRVMVDKNDFSLILDGSKVRFDCIFVAIHGTPGEDGKLQGYLEMMDLPYTSCDWIVSALTFDKEACKTLVSYNGVVVPPTIMLKTETQFDKEKILNEIGLPCFVKPNKGGSSVGISRVNKNNELEKAIALAFEEDDEVLVEKFIQGREITCGVFKTKGKLVVLPITEIVSKKEFFDYEAKYEGMSEEITPARIPEEVDTDCKSVSAMLYEKLNCRGVVRFDYIFNNNALYFLEVNTVPGLSEASIVPQQAEEMGLSVSQLFSMLIEDAIERKGA